jgi:hypothetical protein
LSLKFTVILRRIKDHGSKGKHMQQQDEEYISFQEIIKIVFDAGFSEPTFRRLVHDGKIRKRVPPGRKRGAVYSRQDAVHVLDQKQQQNAKSRRTAKPTKQSQRDTTPLVSSVFRKATLDDIPELCALVGEVFDATPIVERWSAWVRRNPDIAYILRSESGVVGAAMLMPHTLEKIESILREEVTPSTLPDEVLEFVPGGPSVDIYIRSVCVRQQGVPLRQRRVWGGQLTRGLYRTIVGLGTQGIVLNSLYSRSDTVDGRRMLHHLGMTRIISCTSHHNYMVDVSTSGLDMITLYKQALSEWRKKHQSD